MGVGKHHFQLHFTSRSCKDFKQKTRFPRRWGHQKAGAWYPRDKKRLRSWGIANVFCKMLLMEIVGLTTCYLWFFFYRINWWSPEAPEPSTVGKKTRFFERLIRQSRLGHQFFCRSSLRTSVARPKSCGALPAMNGTATSGKDLKILEGWGIPEILMNFSRLKL